MDKWNMKKVSIISVIVVVAIIGIVFGGYKYTKINKYNSLIKDANKYMEDSEYDKAIDLFQQSLSYKNDANIENSIKLAKSLTQVKKVYDEGIKLMNNKKHLEAIEQFKKIGKESDKLYNNAQNKINECTKEYVALNINGVNSALKTNKYDEANKYIAEVFKVDNNNEEAKKLKNTIDKKIQEQQAAQKAKEEQEKVAKAAKAAASKITTKSAEDIIRKLCGYAPKTRVEFDSEQTVDGVKYFVIRAYNVSEIGVTATRGWYYVNPSNGKVLQHDMFSGENKPLN